MFAPFKYHSLRTLCPVITKSCMVPKRTVAEMCQRQSYWLPTNNNHPTGQAAPRRLPSSSIVTSQQSAFALRHIGPMAGTEGFPEKCTVLCFESALLFRA